VSLILVLDDRATERDLLSTVLTYAGHTVVQASTGEEALDLARASRPELIMADLVMPGMNGYEFVRELRADPALQNARVVFCTATYDQDEVRKVAESCGVSHTLVKPCEPEDIIRVVSDVLRSDQRSAAHVVTDEFDREQLKVLHTKLIQKVDELELAKRLVEEKAEQLAVSLKYKSEFFSNMSHELRTPLNSLLILAGELKANPDENLTDTQVQYASVIEASGSDLLRLLNDLLDLAKVESGTVVPEIGELPLFDLQYALECEFGPLADQKGMSFSVELASGSGWSPSNPELALADQVIAFSISDTGIGIEAESQQDIFEAFAQGDGTTARRYGGTGLGLSISRQLVKLLGGEMALSSTLGEGSTFTVYLPSAPDGDPRMAIPFSSDAPDLQPRSIPAGAVLALQPTRLAVKAPATRPPTPPMLPAAAGLAGKKVLVVDDDFRNIFAITALLERAEIEVISAESGREGVAILGRTPDIDFVLVDIMMPTMNGYDTMRAMRKLSGGARVPIIALTAKTGNGERERCIEAGASAYIPKPLEADLLLLFLKGKWLDAGVTEGAISEVLM
jgi:CheY-like chemotaxis protein